MRLEDISTVWGLDKTLFILRVMNPFSLDEIQSVSPLSDKLFDATFNLRPKMT